MDTPIFLNVGFMLKVGSLGQYPDKILSLFKLPLFPLFDGAHQFIGSCVLIGKSIIQPEFQFGC